MKKLSFIIILFYFIISSYSFSNEVNCNEYKKLSLNYMKCKTNLIKDKTKSASKNFVESTKNYQKKEWSKEMDKLDNLKKKVIEK